MTTLRETLSQEAEQGALDGPTRFKTPVNQQALYCSECGDLFYVDDRTFRRFRLAIETSDENPFRCADCEEALADEERAH
jgi:hypothetical protein